MSGCEHGMGMCGRFPFSQYPPTSLLSLSFFLSVCYFSLSVIPPSLLPALFSLIFFLPSILLVLYFSSPNSLALLPVFFSSYIPPPLLPVLSIFPYSSIPSFILSPCVYTFLPIYRLLFSPFPFPPFLLFLPRIINFYLYLYISFGKLLMKVHRGKIPWCRA